MKISKMSKNWKIKAKNQADNITFTGVPKKLALNLKFFGSTQKIVYGRTDQISKASYYRTVPELKS